MFGTRRILFALVLLLLSSFSLYAIRDNGGAVSPSLERKEQAKHEAAARAEIGKEKAKLGHIRANADKAAEETQKIINTIDQQIAETKAKINKLEKDSKLEPAMKKAAENADENQKENLKLLGETLRERFKHIGREENPIADAKSKTKEAKRIYDRAIKTFSWDVPVLDAFGADIDLGLAKTKLEKLERSRAACVDYETLMNKISKQAAAKQKSLTSSSRSASSSTARGPHENSRGPHENEGPHMSQRSPPERHSSPERQSPPEHHTEISPLP